MLSAAARPPGVLTWLAVPLLFVASVLGLTALGGVLLNSHWPVILSVAMFGPAAAVTLVIGAGVEWTAPWQRGSIRIAYPVALFGAGLALDQVVVPVPLAIVVGSPALITLVALCVRGRRAITRREYPSETVEKPVAAT